MKKPFNTKRINIVCQNCKKDNPVILNDVNKQIIKCKYCNEIILEYKLIKGVIYVLSNPKMEGLLKIGFTRGELNDRVRDLSNSTGVPTNFEIEAYWYSLNPKEDEAKIHQELTEYRYKSNREFFEISIEKAVEKINDILKKSPVLCNIEIPLKESENKYEKKTENSNGSKSYKTCEYKYCQNEADYNIGNIQLCKSHYDKIIKRGYTGI